MESKKTYIFLGPPYSGKETQTIPLGIELGIPVFSMGQLIREARQDPKIEEAFQQYSLKGLHVPIDIKFGLLESKMGEAASGFILDNFPGSAEDLEVFNRYMDRNDLDVTRVFYLNIDENEIMNRFAANPHRGRADDTQETLLVRSKIQGDDREPVLQYYKEKGKLVEINGALSREAVYQEIKEHI